MLSAGSAVGMKLLGAVGGVAMFYEVRGEPRVGNAELLVFALRSDRRVVTLEGRAGHMESVLGARSSMVCNAVTLLLAARHTECPLPVWTELQLQGTYAGCFAGCHLALTRCTTCPALTRTLALPNHRRAKRLHDRSLWRQLQAVQEL